MTMIILHGGENMRIIEIKTLDNGAHRNQIGDFNFMNALGYIFEIGSGK